jgi:putative ABC transport system permease protein
VSKKKTHLHDTMIFWKHIGAHGVAANTGDWRAHGIGAQKREILRMVLWRGVTLIAAGIGIGLAASCALTRFLASQIWGVSATDPWAFGAVVVLVAGIGSVACYLPARRATRVDPLVALKYE